mgnify:CR=1 FL=1
MIQQLSIISPDTHLYPVFSITYQSSKVAVKAIPVSDKKGSFQNERVVFGLKSHPNILKCIEIVEDCQLELGDSRQEQYNLLILPFAPNGDLMSCIEKTRLSEEIARYYFGQMLDALDHLHTNGLAHRDIKLENVLLDENYNLVLTDFGFAVKHSDLNGPLLFSEKTTPSICPPEFYLSTCYKAIDMDMFALGKLLLTLIAGFPPFFEARESDKYYSPIAKGQWDIFWKRIRHWMRKACIKDKEITPECKSLIEGLLNPDPNARFGIKEVRESLWFQHTKVKNLEDIQRFLQRAGVLSS